MRQPLPHNPAQAFLEDQERRATEYPAAGYQHEPKASANSVPKVFSPAILHGRPVPRRRWIVEDVIPAGNVTMLAGDGGLGKSLLAMQLLTCAAIGKPWLGLGTVQCPSVGVFCEDDRDELHIRQAAINPHYGCEFSDLGSCLWLPRVGEPNVMMHFGGDGAGKATAFYRQVCEKVNRVGAGLVVLDSLHDLFSGDENRRGSARQFVNELRAMILPIDGAVLLLSHPSMSGLNSGTGTAGSTAWHNAVRSRLYLTKPNRKRLDGAIIDDEDSDHDERILKTMKSNYSALGGKIRLRWEHGVFVRQDGAPVSNMVDRLQIDGVLVNVLRELVSGDTRVAADRHAKNGFATMARTTQAAKHLSWQTVADAQDRLLAAGKIVKVEMGPSRNRLRSYLRTPDQLYPSEGKEVSVVRLFETEGSMIVGRIWRIC